MSGTPETEAVANTAWEGVTDDYSAYAKMLAHARNLELERDKLRKANHALTCALSMIEIGAAHNPRQKAFDAMREAEEVMK